MDKFQKFIIAHDRDTFEAYYRTHLNEDVFKQYPELVNLHDLGKIRKLWNIPAKTQEEKNIIIERFCGGSDFYLRLAKQTKEIMLDKYGCWYTATEEYKQKRTNTCQAKYGVDHFFKTEEFKQKAKQTNIARYGVEYAQQALEIQAKQQNTLLTKYGVDNPFKSRELMNKVDKPSRVAKAEQTKRINKTFNRSKYEEYLYRELLNSFSTEDVCRQYQDARYPFRCDFYIKSLDLFIEVNLHWTHYTHPFDSACNEDLAQLELFKTKQTKGYNKLIEVWTVRDPEKLHKAKNSKINYKVLYSKSDIDNLLLELGGKVDD
jgi:hypothetical protein